MRVGIALEMPISGSNEGSTAVVVNGSSKLSLYENGGERDEQVGNDLVANENWIEILVENDGHVEIFDKDEKYPKRERRLLGKWWKNRILPQYGEEWANVALLDDHFNLYKGVGFKDGNKGEAAMQEKYKLLMANGIWELTKLVKGCKNVGCKMYVFHQE